MVVPFLNEVEHLGRVLGALDRQTRFPERLVLVDDGSTDGSDAVARCLVEARAGVQLVRMPPRPRGPDRLARAHELLAFLEAVDRFVEPWDVIAKLDADIELPPRAIEEVLEYLAGNPTVGITGPYLQESGPDGRPRRLRVADDHVHGATKFYRRACWQDIQPLPPILGWDTIDEVSARCHGWRTGSIALSEGDPLHLRPRGSYDGMVRAHRRWGACAWGVGEAPLHVALMTARSMSEPPRVVGGLAYGGGWLLAAAARAPRAAPEVRAAVRREQLGRIRRRLRRLGER